MEVHVCFTELEHGLETLPNSFNLLQRLNQYSFFLGEEVILGYGYNCERGEFDQVALAAARKAMENAIRESNRPKLAKSLMRHCPVWTTPRRPLWSSFMISVMRE